MTFWRLYYHLVWATYQRQPLITAEIEPDLYGYIIGKANGLGVIIHAIGGIDDHIHLVASIPPALSVADFVKGVKGSSAYHINQVVVAPSKFGWQRGYAIWCGRWQPFEQQGLDP